MDMKYIVVCDDNSNDRIEIKSLIDVYLSERKTRALVKYYDCAEHMLAEYTGQIDIAILDVEMDHLNGIDAGYEILKRHPDAALIIVTAYATYLDDAMDLRVFRFFEKPVDKDRFFRAMDIRFRERASLEIPLRNNAISKTKINENDIVCVYSSQRKTNIITDKGQELKTDLNIKEWLIMLDKNNSFASPHYSYIVNLNYILELTSERIVLRCRNGTEIPVYPSKRKYGEFKKKYFKKMEEYR